MAEVQAVERGATLDEDDRQGKRRGGGGGYDKNGKNMEEEEEDEEEDPKKAPPRATAEGLAVGGGPGELAHTLMKLKQFRHFYIVVVGYIYFTRIVVYFVDSTVRASARAKIDNIIYTYVVCWLAGQA
jgi:hypothetical protein